MRVGERADEGRASAPRSTRGRPTRCGEPTNSSSPPCAARRRRRLRRRRRSRRRRAWRAAREDGGDEFVRARRDGRVRSRRGGFRSTRHRRGRRASERKTRRRGRDERVRDGVRGKPDGVRVRTDGRGVDAVRVFAVANPEGVRARARAAATTRVAPLGEPTTARFERDARGRARCRPRGRPRRGETVPGRSERDGALEGERGDGGGARCHREWRPEMDPGGDRGSRRRRRGWTRRRGHSRGDAGETCPRENHPRTRPRTDVCPRPRTDTQPRPRTGTCFRLRLRAEQRHRREL